MRTQAQHPRSRRAGRVPVWLTCALLLLGLGYLVREGLRHAQTSGYTTIDPRRVDLREARTWVVPGWEELLATRLARLGPISSLDAAGVAALVEELGELPFVASVGEARVIWPDGLDVQLELREPVACLRSGGLFLPVSADGTVLPGAFVRPPDTPRGYLPVLGPGASLEGARPGDRLEEHQYLDALSVARSLLEHVPPDVNRRLGPLVVDASKADEAGVREPGTRLLLEERRLVLFGRPPSLRAPGELPAALKWAHLVRGAAALEAGKDWDLLDVRWDRPEMRQRGGD